MVRSKTFGPGNILMMLVIAMAGIYLWGVFTVDVTGFCKQADVDDEKFNCEENADLNDDGILDAANIPREGKEFKTPEDTELEGSTLWIIKLFIVGTVVFVAYRVVSNLAGTRPSRRDIMSLIMLGIAVYFIWSFVIQPSNLLGALDFSQLTLDQIGTKAAMKLGLA